MTLENEKRFLLLLSSYQLCKKYGSVSKADVLDNIEDNDWIVLNEEDLKLKDNRNELVWRNDLAFVRKHLALHGWYVSDQRNNWGITESGISYLKDLYKELNNQSVFKKISGNAIDYANSLF